MRRSLRAQIARLERRLPPGPSAEGGGARLLSLEELEQMRDGLVHRLQRCRFAGGKQQERQRILRERMALEPAKYFGRSVSNAEVGEPGCGRWSSWFRLRISGGCP